MKTIATGDWHLTDNPRDEYRWGIFPWLAGQVKKHKVGRIALLGDVTDAKDRHSEALANRLVDEIAALADSCEVIWSPGNHDGHQEGRPFFRFASHVKNLLVLTEPEMTNGNLFLPNTRDHTVAWAELGGLFKQARYVFCHQTFENCLSENGMKLPGIPHDAFGKTKALIFSGDIHVPQIVSQKPRIEYVGAPYRIRFGDSFTPRLLLIEDKGGIHSQKDLHFPAMSKHLLEIDADDVLASLRKKLGKLDFNEGDQLKIRIVLPRTDFPRWKQLREEAKALGEKAGLEIFGPELRAAKQQAPAKESPAEAQEGGQGRQSPKQALAAYARKEGLPKPLIQAGKLFLAGE